MHTALLSKTRRRITSRVSLSAACQDQLAAQTPSGLPGFGQLRPAHAVGAQELLAWNSALLTVANTAGLCARKCIGNTVRPEFRASMESVMWWSFIRLESPFDFKITHIPCDSHSAPVQTSQQLPHCYHMGLTIPYCGNMANAVGMPSQYQKPHT